MALGQRNREEVVNTQLALLISQLGVVADAETDSIALTFCLNFEACG